MIKLITQYNKVREDDPFDIGTGWDGASGPWVFHIIDTNNFGSSIAKYVGIEGHTGLDKDNWTGIHLNNFILELVYD